MKRDAPPLFKQCGGDVPHRDIPAKRGLSSGTARGPGCSGPLLGSRVPPPDKKRKMRERKKRKGKKERKEEKKRKKERARLSEWGGGYNQCQN